PRRRVFRVHLEPRLALEVAEALQVRERRIEEMPGGRRDESERVALGAGPALPAGRLGGRVVGRKRIEAQALQPLAVELAAPGRRREAALGERREAAGHLEPLPAGRLYPVPVDAAHARARRAQ